MKEELIAKEKKDNPANFGYLCEKPCICKFVGQVPCSGVVPVPEYMRGKWLIKNLHSID